ncbi:MFS transporter [Oricola cellulosilytica]|uniref:MFS transporter n=1 Tax=Oricola cellulosilytica TaxID=1429082 RepID=A0A4R0PBC0_9HYPH|nr:MFS transporter [Oricola cellulosilytica]TCD14346.1 MFS transporter [Oricola cellulosilytica]
MNAAKRRALVLLVTGEVLAMSLWFVSAAILPGMVLETAMSPGRQAALSSAVQAGFVFGALFSAFLGLPDRFDPRRVIAFSAISAGLCNALLLLAVPGGGAAIAARFATGALLAGVYPVGMKIAVGWGQTDRGLLVGLLVAAVTLGSASPHLFALTGGPEWRTTVLMASVAAIGGGLLSLLVTLGPYHAAASRFDPRAIFTAWTNRKVRLAYAGYLGHMWELYAMWAWIAVVSAASYGFTTGEAAAARLATVTAFSAIAIGAVMCVYAGRWADRIGKANVASIAMALSGGSAVLAAATFGGPVWLTFAVVMIWGAAIIPDSAQFSALVADNAPADQAGSLMTLQTALGFALTIATVQLTPMAAEAFGWRPVLVGMALGPAFGIAAMMRLKRLG